jgi:hypothetical protein
MDLADDASVGNEVLSGRDNVAANIYNRVSADSVDNAVAPADDQLKVDK